MHRVRLIAEYWPEIAHSPMGLLLVIGLSFALLLFKSTGYPLNIFETVPLLNGVSKIADVLLVLIPIAFIYTMTAVVFAYNTGRRTIDIPETIFFPCFVLPCIGLALAQLGLILYFATDTGVRLKGNSYFAASAAVTAAIVCLIWVEIFMSFAKVVSKTLQNQIQPLETPLPVPGAG
jgi:hypothetical protein